MKHSNPDKMGNKWHEPCEYPSIHPWDSFHVAQGEEPSWSLEYSMSWDRAETDCRKKSSGWTAQSTSMESTVQRVPLGYSAGYWSIETAQDRERNICKIWKEQEPMLTLASLHQPGGKPHDSQALCRVSDILT